MDAHLTKDEKNYIQNNASDSYLLLKHEPREGIDYFSVYDQDKIKKYTINNQWALSYYDSSIISSLFREKTITLSIAAID